jgi:hypothetical protein
MTVLVRFQSTIILAGGQRSSWKLASTCRKVVDPDERGGVNRRGRIQASIGNWPVLSDVCDSESDSDHSDHGENRSYASMYTPDTPGPDGKPKNGGPQKLSETQALALRAAAHCAPNSVEPTIQTY